MVHILELIFFVNDASSWTAKQPDRQKGRKKDRQKMIKQTNLKQSCLQAF